MDNAGVGATRRFHHGLPPLHVLLALLTAWLALVGWARHRAWYRPRVTRPCSALIATVRMFWSVQRVLFP